jgi:hypothetical protein
MIRGDGFARPGPLGSAMAGPPPLPLAPSMTPAMVPATVDFRLPGHPPEPPPAADNAADTQPPVAQMREAHRADTQPADERPVSERRPAMSRGAGAPPRAQGQQRPMDVDDSGFDRGTTAPQLRRFIKSRAYVPMHELRRRFGINGNDDDVTPVDVDRSRVFVGLPEREGHLLGELFRGGDIGYELSLDPVTPIVVGVYPMRPVSRG